MLPTQIFMLALAVLNFIQVGFIYGRAEIAQMFLDKAWQNTLQQDHQAMKYGASLVEKLGSWSDSWPVARLVFPDQTRDLIVLNHGSGRSMAFGPSHLAGSALLGENGVSVIGGHKDTHFKFLEQSHLRDEVWLQLPTGKAIRYRVTGMQITDISSSKLLLESDHSVIVLVACYPFWGVESGNTLRVLVIAEPY